MLDCPEMVSYEFACKSKLPVKRNWKLINGYKKWMIAVILTEGCAIKYKGIVNFLNAISVHFLIFILIFLYSLRCSKAHYYTH